MVELSNHQVQDILDDKGMIDENGNCPYTAEEIFKAGVEYAKKTIILKSSIWLIGNGYFTNNPDSIKDFIKMMEK